MSGHGGGGTDAARRLLFVHAHPDDESSKGAATAAHYVDAGARVTLVTCTDGAAGDVLNPSFDAARLEAVGMAAVRREGVGSRAGGHGAQRRKPAAASPQSGSTENTPPKKTRLPLHPT